MHSPAQAPDMPPVQHFDVEPDDSALATWVSPENDMLRAKVYESPAQLVVKPARVPMWFVTACVAVPTVSLFYFVGHRMARSDQLSQSDLVFLSLAIVMAILGSGSVVGIIAFLNRCTVSKPASFVLDKTHQTLELPRFGVTLTRSHILAIVEVRGSYKDGSCNTTLGHRELSVLAKDADNRFTRYPLKVDRQHPGAVRAAREIATHLQVPLKVLKLACPLLATGK